MAVRRIVDVAVSAAGLVFIGPLLALTAILIKLESRGPVFYVSDRAGQGGTPFPFIKFRTMVQGAENMGLGLELAREDERITRVGRWLRRFSLDELPQLINVLRGDMSLVGPRPATTQQAANYTPFQARRLEVKPGMTGWAQVNGRNAITWPERIKLDVWYVDNRSLWLDLKILLRTPLVVLRQEGIYGADGINRAQ